MPVAPTHAAFGDTGIRMNSARWQQVKEIFDEAVEFDSAARAEFVRQRCGGDDELRKEVESLLASDEESGSRLQNPVVIAAALAAASVEQPALILKDRYEVERELGRGGMSVVYLARDRQLLDKRVVVKVLLDNSSLNPWIRQKFLQEMEALARIDHPGVVGVLDTGLTAEGKQFTVMQYLEGVTLRRVIEPGGMNFSRAAGILRQIGQALAAAHEKGVWHRDLKPENIMLQRLGGEDHVKLIDFGIAGIQNSRFSGEKTNVAGSLSYMAPEQFTGHPCAASDIYALGVVAYELLTGKLPFPTDSMAHLASETSAHSTPARQLRPDLSWQAESSIRKALSFRPEQRHADARQFTEELCQALNPTVSGSSATRKTSVPGTIEMAHVLFTDLVGYSLLPMDQQREHLAQLQQIVQDSTQFRSADEAGELISLPTGDGMALAFFVDPTAPVQCAVEVATALKSRPHLKLRMGIHSGPVYRVADVNANANLAGGGINMAQRVMDCGDAGHILLSKSVADVLHQLSQWAQSLTDLGECEVKHGVKVHLFNLSTAEFGNPRRPRKLAGRVLKAKSRTIVAAAVALVLIAAAAWWFGRTAKNLLSSQNQASIAVLPFRDINSDKNQEYFSEGISEELRDTLSKIPGLPVVARTSSSKFGGNTDDCHIIGTKLNVANLLEGSVRKQGNRAKIAVQLIKTADCFQIWSETYDKELNDVFAVQDEIAGAVAGVLKVKLLGVKKTTKSTSAEAYNAYLQGQYFLVRRNWPKAVGYFQDAIKLDPNYAPALVGLGEGMMYYIPAEEAFGDARDAVQRALKINPDLGTAHAAMVSIDMFYYSWAAAEVSSQRALTLAPGDATVITRAGDLSRALGRFDQAMTRYSRAIQVDPLNPAPHLNLGIALYYAGRQEEAKAAFRKALELSPNLPNAHGFLGLALLEEGRADQALDEVNKEPFAFWRQFALVLTYHALKRNKDSDAALAELIAKFQADAPFQIAEAYAFRGEKDRAFEWLERAYKDHDPAVRGIKGDPLLKSVENDGRYAAFLKKMGLPM